MSPSPISPDFNHPLAVKIRKQITQALNDFNMLQEGDKLMVCVSGGKDSSILAALLTEIQKKAPFHFQFEAVILDQKQPGFAVEAFKNWIQNLGVTLHIVERDTYSIVTEKVPEGKTFCSLCSRLRRAILYDFASHNQFTKMALGHHRDDVVNTTLLNLFYSGKLASMPAKLTSDDGRNIILRPLCYVSESDLEQLAKDWGFPVIPCNLCGSQDGLKRKRMKKLVQDLEKEIPNISATIQNALTNVNPSHLMDHKIWDFDKNQPKISELSSPQDALQSLAPNVEPTDSIQTSLA